MVDFIITGLGNPGELYQDTPHNLGFDVVDAWATYYGLEWKQDKKHKAQTTLLKDNGKTLLGVKPYSFMNNSGGPVQSVCSYYKCPPHNVIVICDEVALPFMQIKIRRAGGAGGHNGVKDIINKMGSDIMHYRVGIGPKPFENMPLEDYVLSPLSPEQRALRREKLPSTIEGLRLLVEQGPEVAMNLIHGL